MIFDFSGKGNALQDTGDGAQSGKWVKTRATFEKSATKGSGRD